MGNPDLELQNPDQEDPHRRRDVTTTTGSFRAVAAGLLLAIGVWTLCADATTWSILRLQQQGLINVNSGGGEALAVSNGGGGGGTGSLVDKAERCAIRNFMKDTSFLDCVEGISTEEFLERRNKLAKVLKDEGVAAFVIEPGFTFEYYANVSKTDWEPFELDERPFLMVIRPEEADDGSVTAKTSFLAPHFEVSRVRMLPIPRAEPELDVVVWEEHWNPYATLRRSRLFPAVAAHNPAEVDQRPWLMVDAEMRSFIVGGLWDAGFRFRDLSPAVRKLPQVKTPSEVAILRAVNAASTGPVGGGVQANKPVVAANPDAIDIDSGDDE
ncbi:hypothetical protein NLG97_g8107 [Lecanicillium saksenae]|uniref:Uncharacterized protein n=1 Tax=Lecanicillium saksenae TaxID=468837 RepID=A0ACC1QKF7_9HYPO|nr:hypothetical protein NLG97_g8107 [Lecanicillium saksenae]